jgi:hypothetical protein
MTQPTPGPWSSSDEHGEHSLPCGCLYRIGFRSWKGASQRRAEVAYCPLHTAAPELLAALETVAAFIAEAEKPEAPQYHRASLMLTLTLEHGNAIRAAIAKAKEG